MHTDFGAENMKLGEDLRRWRGEISVGWKHVQLLDRKLQEAWERRADGMFIILPFTKHARIIKGWFGKDIQHNEREEDLHKFHVKIRVKECSWKTYAEEKLIWTSQAMYV